MKKIYEQTRMYEIGKKTLFHEKAKLCITWFGGRIWFQFIWFAHLLLQDAAGNLNEFPIKYYLATLIKYDIFYTF